MSRLAWWFGMAVLAASVAAAGETEVTGKGYAQSRQPAETTNPPGSWTTDDAAHDPEVGAEFASVHDYDLRQGARADDKAAWSDTDYVRWVVHGATLAAEGQAQDSRSDAATVVTSEAWGGERIEVEVTKEEGDRGRIRAENTIGFEYDYAISGPKIGEAGVALQGTAWDLKGNAHPFALSAVVGESVTEEIHERGGLRVGYSEQSSSGVSLSSKDGIGVSLGGQSSFEIEAEAEEGFRVTRRFAQADGDSGSTPSIRRSDAVEGPTPLRRTFSVWSDGFVRLLARSAADDSTVVVQLHRYRVRNSLRAWKEAFVGTQNPDGGGDPGGPTTGGDDPLPDDDPPGPTTPGAGAGDPPPPDGDVPPGGGIDTGSVAWGETRLWARAGPPRGLAGEIGGWPGAVVARLAAPQDRDLVLEAAVEPPDALDLGTTLTLPAGRVLGVLPYRALRAGPAAVTLRVLDDSGAPTADALELVVDAASVGERTAPDLWVTVEGRAWRPGGGAVVHGEPGEDVGPLRIGRTGHAGLGEEALTVTVAVDDPDGILPALPASVTIHPGKLAVPLPLVLGSAGGRATLTVAAGDQSATATFVSEPPSWHSVSRVVVPLGAEAAVPFLTARPAAAERVVSLESAAPERVAVEPEAVLLRREGAWYALVWGTALGESVVTLRSDDLPDLEVTVEVVPERVACRDGRIELAGLDGTRAGSIFLAAPPGVRFAALALPPAATDYLDVTGLGTGRIALALSPSADMPGSLSLPVLFEGASEAPLRIDVYETYDDPDPAQHNNSYRIDVR